MMAGYGRTFAYFAYGSNMHTLRLRERTPSAVAEGVGYISGFRLAFDKISIDGSGKCNVVSTRDSNDRVYGVLFDIAMAETEALDKAEGLGTGYVKSTVTVITEAAEWSATTYIADRTNPLLRPYTWYMKFVICGGVEHGLPESYVEQLRLTPSQADPDLKRSASNEALLRRPE